MNDDLRLAMKGLELIGSDHVLVDLTTSAARVQAYSSDPYLLMKSMAVLRGASQKIVFLDMPRASMREGAKLIGYAPDGSVGWSEVSHSDLDYRLRNKANCLVSAKLALDCLDPEGVLLAIATPETYMAVRGAAEHWLGPDKFIGEVVYQIRAGGGNDSRWLSIEHETLLIFSMNPESVSGFRLKRTAEEIASYDEKDDEGPYCWDTYIRKQARQYYPITCPDGSVLELDESGNRISWLYSHETFKAKLKKGDVKFEKNLKKGWRLFYKARLTELDKIMRSIVTNQSPLSDIVAGADPELTGKIFLTASGSAEIKGCPAEGAPAFLKSSEYYKFIVSTFSSGGPVYFPFNENGSALIAGLSDDLKGRAVTIGNACYSKNYVLWRVASSNMKATELDFSEGRKLDLLHINSEDEEILYSLVKSGFADVVNWHDFSSESFDVAVGDAKVPVLILKKIKDEKKRLDLLAAAKAENLILNSSVRIVSKYSPILVRGLYLIPDDVSVEQVPMMFLK
jgi:hypothetical protein